MKIRTPNSPLRTRVRCDLCSSPRLRRAADASIRTARCRLHPLRAAPHLRSRFLLPTRRLHAPATLDFPPLALPRDGPSPPCSIRRRLANPTHNPVCPPPPPLRMGTAVPPCPSVHRAPRPPRPWACSKYDTNHVTPLGHALVLVCQSRRAQNWSGSPVWVLKNDQNTNHNKTKQKKQKTTKKQEKKQARKENGTKCTIPARLRKPCA